MLRIVGKMRSMARGSCPTRKSRAALAYDMSTPPEPMPVIPSSVSISTMVMRWVLVAAGCQVGSKAGSWLKSKARMRRSVIFTAGSSWGWACG